MSLKLQINFPKFNVESETEKSDCFKLMVHNIGYRITSILCESAVAFFIFIFILPYISFHRFACAEPTLNVRYNDYINFFCPNYDIHPQATQKQEDISESMYVVKDKEHFKTCNATGMFTYSILILSL